MKDALAEKLLAHVMQWGADAVARERPYLQAMAAYKYDEYQQFSPGMRFVESLARWLNQFETQAERETAFDFVKGRLLFVSTAEMNHLAETAYPDHVRPALLRRAAGAIGASPHHIGRVVTSPVFRQVERRCLFLGLSDGARIDVFRRANRELSHEQIVQTHELADTRVADLLEELEKDLAAMPGGGSAPPLFNTIVLLDDFSASGTSYYALEPKADGTLSGKIAKFRRQLLDPEGPLRRLVDPKDLEVVVLLYVATEHAKNYLTRRSAEVWADIASRVEIVQLIPDAMRLPADGSDPLAGLIQAYYDSAVFTKHFKKGGTADARYGYAGGALPLILHHNTPNNSIALLWSYEELAVCGLFPRVSRHKEAT